MKFRSGDQLLSLSIIRLAETINHTLIGRRQMIVTAESCTGGLIAGALTKEEETATPSAPPENPTRSATAAVPNDLAKTR